MRKQGMEQVSEVGNHFLESCHIETKGFLQQFRPFQYSSQVSETTLNYTN